MFEFWCVRWVCVDLCGDYGDWVGVWMWCLILDDVGVVDGVCDWCVDCCV